MRQDQPKPVVWLGTSRRDLREMPEDVQDKIGTTLQRVQYGTRPASVKTLSGFGSASVLEIKVSDDGNAYRAVYTVQYPEYLFVLHVFQKKSRQGIQTSQQDLNKIRDRLKLAEVQHQELTDPRNRGN